MKEQKDEENKVKIRPFRYGKKTRVYKIKNGVNELKSDRFGMEITYEYAICSDDIKVKIRPFRYGNFWKFQFQILLNRMLKSDLLEVKV